MDKFLKKVALGSSITFLSMIIIKAMSLVNSIIAARLLSPADYGALSIIINLGNLAVIIACFGIPLAITKFISELEKTNRSLAKAIGSALLAILIVSSAVAAGIYLIISGVIATELYGDDSLTRPIQLSALLVLIASLNLGLASILQGCQRIKTLAHVNAVVSILAQPITFTAIFIFGLEGAIVALTASNCISACIFLLTAYRALGVSLTLGFDTLRKRQQIRPLISFAFPVFISGLILIAAHWVGRTSLAIQWDLSQVGQFQIADSLSQVMLIFSAAMSVPLLPLISENSHTQSSNIGGNAQGLLHITGVLVMPTSVLLFPFLGFAVVTLYGADYSIAYHATVVMFSAATLKMISSIISNVIIGTGRVWQALWLNVAWLAVFLFALSLLVSEHGSEGLAGVYAISFAIYLLTLLIYFGRVYDVDVTRLSGLVIAYCITVSVFAVHLSGTDFVVRLGYSAVCSAILGSAGYVGVLSLAERQQFWSLMRGGIRSILRR